MRRISLIYLLALCFTLFFGGSGFAQFDLEFKAYPGEVPLDNSTMFGGAVSCSGDFAIIGAHETNDEGIPKGAAYIYKRNAEGDKWEKVKKLTASDRAGGDEFGRSVAISGDTAIIGAPENNTAYIFSRNQGGADNWGELKILTAGDGVAGDYFGGSVSIDGDTAVVGAEIDRHPSGHDNAGSATIFDRNEGGADNWGQVKKIFADDASYRDHLGQSVSISGNNVIVGAYLGNTSTNAEGGAYVFSRDQGGTDNWGQVKKLASGDPVNRGNFGLSVSIDGNLAIAGAIAGSDPDSSNGAIYMFSQNQGGADNWGQTNRLIASDGDSYDNYGRSVALKGDFVIVGAFDKNDVGAAYIYSRNQGGTDNWGEMKKFSQTTSYYDADFGSAVAINSDYAVVGAENMVNTDGSKGTAYFYSQPTGTHIHVAPKQINMATTIRNEVIREITIVSGGTTDLTVSVSDPGGDFSLSNLPAIVPAGTSATFNIKYKPNSAGSDISTINITHNDANDPTITLNLQGNALNPAAPGAAYASTGYNDGGRILAVDTTSGAASLLTDVSGYTYLQALAIDSKGGIIVGTADLGGLHRIDPITGAVVHHDDETFLYMALAFDKNDVLYGTYSDVFYIVDPHTSRGTYINTLAGSVTGLAFDPIDGKLYASMNGYQSTLDPDGIYTIDTVTGETTLVGTTGLGGGTPDIAFDAKGNLYGLKGGGKQADNNLISINKTTGAGAIIGPTGFTSVGGLDIYNNYASFPWVMFRPAITGKGPQ
jgi:hypothetical protein